MSEHTPQMKSIWYLVGLMLLVMGIVVAAAGIVQYFHPPAEQTVLAELHPSLWWGLLMIAAGIAFALGGRNRRN